jgi:hypothetical protein
MAEHSDLRFHADDNDELMRLDERVPSVLEVGKRVALKWHHEEQ